MLRIAGKSTLLAHLLLKLGAIDSHLLARAEREAAEAGRVKGAYAWVRFLTLLQRSSTARRNHAQKH